MLGAITLDLFLGGAVALLPAIAQNVLHMGPSGFGLLRSAPSFGAIAMALSIARYSPPCWSVDACQCFYLWDGHYFACVSSSFSLSMGTLILIGAADPVSVVVRRTLINVDLPHTLRGWMNAVSHLFVGASNELGELESGMTATWFGTVGAVGEEESVFT
ncbi:hypothetical protein [Pajaroellobacter abortibovis]|uniref:Major facilitator superfamily (MFS) profile domain-containing protein n=1 Tax=Pajaroellobacter abortibovis TaxID=1882918 RepID=A0A1L6MW29_9BACT|nr:hypothetical protein [Pajaroellobacter abortibovis]APR99753.1 hypothetical protein BCY86_02980 [Pajaroellobacter abortibovis]